MEIEHDDKVVLLHLSQTIEFGNFFSYIFVQSAFNALEKFSNFSNFSASQLLFNEHENLLKFYTVVVSVFIHTFSI